ncbi:MAG: trimethylamine methyltransferase family protein [Pseudomonadota bacterium]
MTSNTDSTDSRSPSAPNRSVRRTRGGGREARKMRREQASPSAPPYITRKIGYFSPFDEEMLTLIEQNSNRVLHEIGIEFRGDAEVLDYWKKAGARIDGERVHFDPGLCQSIIRASAPSQFIQHARNSDRNVVIGGDHMVLVPAYGPPFIHNLDEGRRYATLEDFKNFIKLAWQTPHLHHSGGTVCEPVDIPVNKRHLDMVYSHIRYSDKPFMGSVTTPERAEDSVKMAEILFGEDFVDQHCVLVNLINANSPMVFDDTMLGALKVYARHNQACIVSPFILAGAMSPVTVVGTLTQLYAEALAGMALTQLIRPGAPVVFGTFASSISMQSGAPTFGTPEPSLVLFGAASLARRLGVPFRSGGGLCASKLPDAQAAYESANTLQSAAFAGVNFMLHTAGWLEGGLAMGYEKFIMDCDQAGMLARLVGGIDCSVDAQAMDALHQVGPGQHFLGCDHTQRNFETAFYRSAIADNNSYEQWLADGSQDLAMRANGLWKSMLAEYQPPALDPALDEKLQAFIKARKAAMPDSNI